MGLFEMDSSTGRLTGSVSVSSAARSVAETSTGVIGLALGTSRSGALQLLSGTGKVTKTVPLPAPAREVVVGSDGTTFYVLNGTATAASVTIVGSREGRILGSVPMPSDAVSVVPDPQQSTLYALERNGLVDQIDITGGKVVAKFKAAGKEDTGRVDHAQPGRQFAVRPEERRWRVQHCRREHRDRSGPQGPAGTE